MTAPKKTNGNVPEGALVDTLEAIFKLGARGLPVLRYHASRYRITHAWFLAAVTFLLFAGANPPLKAAATGWVAFWCSLTWWWVANPREAERRRKLKAVHLFHKACVAAAIHPKDRPGHVDRVEYPRFVTTKWWQRDPGRPWRRANGPGITLDGPNVYGTVRTPDRMSAVELRGQEADLAAAWPKDRRWGYPEMIRLTQASRNRARELDIAVIVRPLDPPDAYTIVPPAGLHTLDIGQGLTGPIEWDTRDDAHAYIAGPTRPLAVDTPIATPSGWSTMGDLRVGDLVFDDAGTPTKVTGVSDVFHGRPCYELVFDDGTHITADAEHNWVTWDLAARNNETYRARNGKNQWRDSGPKVRSTAEISATVQASGMGTAPRKNHSIPVGGALVQPDAELLVDPYVLGVWLGDGLSRSGKFLGIDDEIAAEVRAAGYTVSRRPHHSNASVWLVNYDDQRFEAYARAEELMAAGACLAHAALRTGVSADALRERHVGTAFGGPQHFCRATRSATCPHARADYPPTLGRPGLQVELAELGVLGDKHIPTAYLRASFDQRLALLQGLMDTDGTCTKQGTADLGLSNRRLIGQARELVISLGHKAGPIRERTTRLGGPAYRFSWTAPHPVFRLQRKLERQKLSDFKPWVTTHRYIAAVRPVPSVPVRCITVAADSHLFLAGEAMVPTHNSGKGDLARRLATSALLGGWRVAIFDRTGSAEWSLVGRHPSCIYTYCDPSDPEAWFTWASDTFASFTTEIGRRNRWLAEHDTDTWAHYADTHGKATVLKDMPPLLIVFDELTSTLGPGAGSDELKKLQREVGGQVDIGARSYAKAGGHVVLVDQITHQGDTTLGSGTRAQLGRWVAVGALDEEHRPMVSGIRNWPWIPEAAKGHGCTGRRGQTAHEVRWGECPRTAIAASLTPEVRP